MSSDLQVATGEKELISLNYEENPFGQPGRRAYAKELRHE
jgi:hypothetical protein